MLEVNVTSNVRQFRRRLDRWKRDQVPFATSRALNATAFDVRKTFVEKSFPRAFDLKNKSFPRAMLRVAKSSKKSLIASVYDRLGREYIRKHIEGGTKTPKGAHIAIPKGVRVTGRGVTPAKRPRQILQRPDVFISKAGGGGEVILQRMKSGKTKLLYFLTPKAKIDPVLDLERDGKRVVDREFRKHFGRELARAIRTARR